MTDRVDKEWKKKGLSSYSLEAIIGTLQHYGVALDQAAFKAEAETKYPLEWAAAWRGAWKGKGQFEGFPYVAADELCRRLAPGRITPMQLAHTIINAVAKGLRTLKGEADETSAALAEFEEKVKTLPPQGERRDMFNAELVGFIDSWAQPFTDLPRQLAEAGKKDLALRYATMQEAIFPERAGTVTLMVDAVSGNRGPAVEKLAAQCADAAKETWVRFAALDALVQLKADPELKATGLALFDAAAQAEQWRLCDTVAHALAEVAQRHEGDEVFMQAVVARLELAHQRTGGHQHHH